MKALRILVCGGRNYRDVSAVLHALTVIHERRGVAVLIEGGATGADRLAREWAQQNGVQIETYAADWDMYGPGAGPMRNAKMLREGKPDGVVAFPGGRGTADMVTKAEAAGVKVWKINNRPAAEQSPAHNQTEE